MNNLQIPSHIQYIFNLRKENDLSVCAAKSLHLSPIKYSICQESKHDCKIIFFTCYMADCAQWLPDGKHLTVGMTPQIKLCALITTQRQLYSSV